MKWYQVGKENFLVNKKGFLLYSGLIGLFFFWFLSIFNPDIFGEMEEIFESYPDVIKSMVGGQLLISTFEGFMNVYIYSFAWMYFGLYFILKVSQDIPTEIEEKTINIILTKPLKRWEYVTGKLLRYIFSIVILVVIAAAFIFLGIFNFPNVDPTQINIGAIGFSLILLSLHILSLATTGLLFSTFLSRRKSLIVSFSVMIVFYMIGQFYALFPEEFHDIKYFSIFYYFDTSTLLIEDSLETFFLDVLVLSLYSAALIVASLIIFRERNIPV